MTAQKPATFEETGFYRMSKHSEEVGRSYSIPYSLAGDRGNRSWTQDKQAAEQRNEPWSVEEQVRVARHTALRQAVVTAGKIVVLPEKMAHEEEELYSLINIYKENVGSLISEAEKYGIDEYVYRNFDQLREAIEEGDCIKDAELLQNKYNQIHKTQNVAENAYNNLKLRWDWQHKRKLHLKGDDKGCKNAAINETRLGIWLLDARIIGRIKTQMDTTKIPQGIMRSMADHIDMTDAIYKHIFYFADNNPEFWGSPLDDVFIKAADRLDAEIKEIENGKDITQKYHVSSKCPFGHGAKNSAQNDEKNNKEPERKSQPRPVIK